MKITKAILLVAGKGTRMMPLTLHQPKGMVALADKPVVHYVIDELVAAGLAEIIIVHGPDQKVFKKYIDHLGKDHEWNSHVKFNFICQKTPSGDGDAVLAAKKFVKKDEPFVVAFCDNVFAGKIPSLALMEKKFNEHGLPTILCVRVPRRRVGEYGVAKLGSEKTKNFFSITNFVEKPKPEKAPSNFVVLGRYVLPFKIFGYLEKLRDTNNSSEIRIANALKLFVDEHKKFWGFYDPKNISFDCGSKEGLIKAQVYFSFHHPQTNKKELKNLLR